MPSTRAGQEFQQHRPVGPPGTASTKNQEAFLSAAALFAGIQARILRALEKGFRSNSPAR